eukprot:gene7054-7636_t
MSWFKSKPVDTKQQLRTHKRELQNEERELQREINRLQREEQKLQQEIKAAARKGDQYTAKMLAKQLVQTRKARTRQYQVKGNISSIKSQTSTMQATSSMAKAMGTATKTMSAMNTQMDPQRIAKVMAQFEQENMKMEQGQEIMEDTLDRAFDDSDMEDETDGLVNQVLEEVGLDVSSSLSLTRKISQYVQLHAVPNTALESKSSHKAAAKISDEDELLARLESLK